ncbi:serine threonine kinase Nek3, putative [Babesia ovis]|uniref:non-specific serine/threonine protein kinase n=1 Tax=Babesia ovis TaxID=5869 RepID=A0A9W5TA57_BABOV|nr:serine threonine kinase Nek3, putative [Babesia ovis]
MMVNTVSNFVFGDSEDSTSAVAEDIRTISTDVTKDEVYVVRSVDCSLLEEASTLLPEESIADFGLQTLANMFYINGYQYCGEALSRFTLHTYYTYHIVRCLSTGDEYFAKVLDLNKVDPESHHSHPVEQVAIAEYLTEHSCGYNASVLPNDDHSSKDSIFSSAGQQNYEMCGKDIDITKFNKDGNGLFFNQCPIPSQSDEDGKLKSLPCSNDERGKCNIVFLWDSFVTDENHLVAIYENCSGGDLWSMIAKARQNGMQYFSEEFVATVFTQVCMAVKYLHDHHIVHGDIKASNIMFKDECISVVKLGDYDTCHFLGLHASGQGTLMYRAPEMLLNSTVSTYATDVWALGCLLYELLTLSHPFANPCSLETMMTTFSSFETYKDVLLSKVPIVYSQRICNSVGLILQSDPNQRPSVTKLLSLMAATTLDVGPNDNSVIS